MIRKPDQRPEGHTHWVRRGPEASGHAWRQGCGHSRKLALSSQDPCSRSHAPEVTISEGVLWDKTQGKPVVTLLPLRPVSLGSLKMPHTSVCPHGTLETVGTLSFQVADTCQDAVCARSWALRREKEQREGAAAPHPPRARFPLSM